MTKDSFLNDVTQKNHGEKEFIQAVTEVVDSVWDEYAANPVYREENILERIVEPERVVMFRVPWIDDKGKIRVNRGYRVEFNSALGPYKGGLRFHPSVNLSILKFLGFEQIFKNALTTLSMGGAKGGSDFDPHDKSNKEVMRFSQSFMSELYRHIGSRTDVPAGDIGVGAREIGYLYGQYKRLKNEFTGVLTGKGADWGGSHIRPEATGYGAVYLSREILREAGDSLEGKRVVMSGSGNVAQYAVQKMNDLGAKVVTLSDSSGYIYDPDGISGDKWDFLMDLKNTRRGRIKEYAREFGCEYHAGERPWGVEADIAMPCATENEIDGADADKLIRNGVKLVTEGANMPLTPEAINKLKAARILYAPGKAANAGGVATSGLEMIQNYTGQSWQRHKVDKELQLIMKQIHAQSMGYGKEADGYIDYMKGANIAAFKKVANAMIEQGVV